MSRESIITNNLAIGYPGRVVQSALSLSFMEGELVCLLGPNGCGKSTLLRTLAGLIPPIDGTYQYVHSSAQTHGGDFSLVLTSALSVDNTSVHDVIAMGRYPYTSFLGHLTDDDEQAVRLAAEQVGVEQLMHTPFNAHSDGEKQRILIAKALAQQTQVILLDEPTAHLDLPNRIRVLSLLHSLAHNENKTILISTHELDLALQLSDRILLMSPDQGGAVLDSADNLRASDSFTRAFGMDIFHIGDLSRVK